jgi:uncharacterized protein YndB with AHSA1/START domain
VTRIERRYRTTLDEMWDLWTTPSGVEAWWGPAGFTVTVAELDPKPGGTFRYTMAASDEERIAFMLDAGMPVTVETSATFTAVERPHRLAFATLVNFAAETAPYEVETVVDLVEEGDYVRLVLTLQAMHDPEWTARAKAGWESQLDKLAGLFGETATRNAREGRKELDNG